MLKETLILTKSLLLHIPVCNLPVYTCLHMFVHGIRACTHVYTGLVFPVWTLCTCICRCLFLYVCNFFHLPWPVPGCTFLCLSILACTCLDTSLKLSVPVCTWMYFSVHEFTCLHISDPVCTFLYLSSVAFTCLYMYVPACTCLYLSCLSLPVLGYKFLYLSSTPMFG